MSNGTEKRPLKNKILALFFTTGVSLKTWDEVGNLSREIKPYKRLAKCFDKIYFFTYGGKSELKYQKLLPQNIKIFPNKWGVSSKLYSLLLPFLYGKKLKETDFLKTNQMNGSWTAILAKWFFRKRLIVRCGYQWSRFAQKQNIKKWKQLIVYLIEKIAYKAADTIIVTSVGDKKYIAKKYNILPAKITYIPNYVDANLFKPINIERQPGHICFVGRLSPQKNLVNLIKAVDGPNIKLTIFGKGELEESLKDRAKRIRAKVEFKENTPNDQLPQELNKNQVFILPSLYEGNPKTLLEAMSCGLPVIGTNVDGIKEIIQHKKNAYLCDTSVKSIRQAILEVLNNKDLREKMGRNARKTILEKFTLEEILAKEIKLYAR